MTSLVNVFGEENLKPIRKYGLIIPDYFVTKCAKIYSNKSKKFLKQNRSVGNDRSSRGSASNYMRVSMNVPIGFFSDLDDFNYYEDNSISYRLCFDVHRVVLEAWKPIDDNPPQRLKDDWDKVPESFRQWVRETAVIDHIDGNPINNHLYNLRWCTPKENNSHRKEHEFAKIS